MSRICSFVFLVYLVASAICFGPANARSWRRILSDFIDFRKKVEPGHPFSEHRIPLDLHLDDIQTTVHSDNYSAHNDFFGKAREFMQGNMSAGAHPRILFSAAEWETITMNYAKGRDIPGSWYKANLDYTLLKGPGNTFLQKLSAIDTSAYTGQEGMNKTALKILSAEVELMGEYHEGGIFMAALHVFVNDKYKNLNNGKGYLPENTYISNYTMIINVVVNYAKILLSHYNVYACIECEYKYGILYSDLWNTFRGWSVNNDWLTAGLGMALTYDVLHDRMTLEERRFMRSAFALMVSGRQHWGITDVSNRYSPNAVLHPHRIFSNWATYHANLFLTNCAIEEETDFDNVTKNVMVNGELVGFNWDVHDKSIALYDAFMKHSIYPEGSTFEDGYMYSLAFREGSLAFIALAKRGINYIDTPRFRNFMYNSAQMHEPFRCGEFIGHSSGGGGLYPASYALFRYSYPESNLTQTLWAQRMGLNFTSYRKLNFFLPQSTRLLTFPFPPLTSASLRNQSLQNLVASSNDSALYHGLGSPERNDA